MRLLGFFVVGAIIVAVMRATTKPELTVRVPADASFEHVAAARDDALLVELGLALGWRSDPLIVDRVLRNLRSVGGVGDDAALLDEAEALDLLRRDPLVRARLIARADAQFGRLRAPSEAELEALRLRERQRFERPTLYRVLHDGPGLALGAVAVRSEAQLVAALGPAARDLVATRALRLGDDDYRVTEVVAATLPPLEQIRATVTGAWRDDASAEARAHGLRELRAAVAVRVEVAE